MTAKFNANSKLSLTPKYDPLELEAKVRAFWEKNQIPKKIAETRKQNSIKQLGYVEGPPTMNGIPHVGHARGRVIKDFHYRLKTMQNYYVSFWAGWDTQGLPVELEVEKTLGAKNKKELIARVGEEKFVEECKKSIMKYHKEWVTADNMLGLFIDHDKAYYTHEDRYIEREWQYLKRAWEQNLLGEGQYVVAYCPHCQTSLSNAEVGLGYKEVEDPSMHFKFRVKGTQNEYFIVWTTMPFTIVTDLIIGVNPNEDYVKVKVDNETWILAKQRVEPIMEILEIENYEIIETFKGKTLEGIKYEYPLADLIPRQAELDQHPLIHTVVTEDFVDVTTATGIVHLAPANGEDDNAAAQKRDLPTFVPFDEQALFTEEAGKFAGNFVRKTDIMVVEELEKQGLLLKIGKVIHEYPTCWRSHHKLIWMARREYFIWSNKINDKVMQAAKKVKYFYESPKNRFFAFLKEGKPWCISRDRVWGSPLPIWVCEECGEKTLVATKQEIREKAIDLPCQDFELHKPWIDRITLKCEKCNGKMFREPFVLDVWHNSGASPYARFTDEEFNTLVPTNFLTEAVDQTRGWANSLLLENVILTGKPQAPYEEFLFQGFVLDAKGRKMSKSLGNVLETKKLLQEKSSDITRFYFLWKCSPIDSMNFDLNELRKRPYQVLSTLYHLHNFFMQNAEYDHFDPTINTLPWATNQKLLTEPDMWLLSKVQKLVRNYTKKSEECEFNFALSELEEFVVNILSREYVPMVRKDLWSDEPETLNRRLAVYSTLWHTLKTLVLLFNPICPFLSETLHQAVYKKLDSSLAETVNLEYWPTPDTNLENDELEQEFTILQETLPIVYSARQNAQLKRRWPLAKLTIVAPKDVQKAISKLESLFLELANVKTVEYADELPELDPELWATDSEDQTQVLVYKVRDDKLEGEGLMRDLARRVQALRKDLGFSPTDIVDAVYLAELEPRNAELLQPFIVEMEELVRTKKITLHDNHENLNADWHEDKLDKKKLYLAVL
ncbi:MAG: isoleucine--tRNA ligase [Candidatus Bathyarchaeum tardum]|nr:MAG: isoleucine--tRNA ligase [Candidatus Bathyarchaeum tardum]